MVSDSKAVTGELLAAISNMVVGVYANCLGRGPTRARSYMDEDVALCLLEDTMTRTERTLKDAGRSERLVELRVILQETMHAELVAGMERLLGREVKTLISGNQADPDVATEVFVLGAPLEADGDAEKDVMPDDRGGRLVEE